MTWKDLAAVFGPIGAAAALLWAGALEQTNREFAAVLVGLGCAAFGAWLIITGHIVMHHRKDTRHDSDPEGP